eukprot:6200764-Pleurochrysis_carterae.AAC.1
MSRLKLNDRRRCGVRAQERAELLRSLYGSEGPAATHTPVASAALLSLEQQAVAGLPKCSLSFTHTNTRARAHTHNLRAAY